MAHTRYSPVSEYQPLHITTTGTTVAVGLCVATTGPAIAAGTNVVVTPTALGNIASGMMLNIADGANTENVRVKGINPTAGTFTADFQFSHSANAYSILSRRGTDLGKLVINQPGSGVTITLYNGHPSLYPDAGTAFAVLTPAAVTSIAFDCSVPKGLFYTVTGGTPGDYTLTYLDHSV